MWHPNPQWSLSPPTQPSEVSFSPRHFLESCTSLMSLFIIFGCPGFSSQCLGLLIVVLLLLQSTESRVWTQELWHADLIAPWPVGSPRLGIKSVPPTLTGGFLTTGPPSKSWHQSCASTYSFNKYLWATYCVSTTSLGVQDTVPSKAGIFLFSQNHHSSTEKDAEQIR